MWMTIYIISSNYLIIRRFEAVVFLVSGILLSSGQAYAQSCPNGTNSVCYGDSSGTNSTADWNVFIGYYSGGENRTGVGNVMVGKETGAWSQSRNSCTFLGTNAGRFNYSSDNTYIGYYSAVQHTTINSSENTFVGSFSGEDFSSGRRNTLIGSIAGKALQGSPSAAVSAEGSDNTFVGAFSGASIIYGYQNTYIGRSAGTYNKGQGSVGIGLNAAFYEEGEKILRIGSLPDLASGDQRPSSNPTLIQGDFSAGLVRINGSIEVSGNYPACLSDRRLKKSIQPVKNAISKVMKLNPVTFEWNKKKYPKRFFRKGRRMGFIAQEVEKIVPEVMVKSNSGLKGMDYGKITALIAKAIQAQQTRISKIIENINLKKRLISVLRKNKHLRNKIILKQNRLIRRLEDKLRSLQLSNKR